LYFPSFPELLFYVSVYKITTAFFVCSEATRRPAEVQSVGLLAVGPTWAVNDKVLPRHGRQTMQTYTASWKTLWRQGKEEIFRGKALRGNERPMWRTDGPTHYCICSNHLHHSATCIHLGAAG